MAKMKEKEYHDSIVERFELACRSLKKTDYQSELDQMYKARNREYMTKPIRFIRNLKQTRLNEQHSILEMYEELGGLSTIKSMLEDAAQQHDDLLDKNEASDNLTDVKNQAKTLMQKDI